MSQSNKETEFFLKIAEENLARYCFLVWDFFTFPEYVRLDLNENTLRSTYEEYTFLYGPPSEVILENFNPRGELILSFDTDWIPYIEKYFTDFSLLVQVEEETKFNTFLCMHLVKDQFKPKENHISSEITEDVGRKMHYKRQLHLSRGFGGVGIFENDTLVGCGFAPHVVQNENFSFAIVRDIWVKPDSRNKGFGYDLSSKICEVSFKKGVKSIFLWVEERNYPAVKIYEKLGFQTKDKSISVVCKKKKKK